MSIILEFPYVPCIVHAYAVVRVPAKIGSVAVVTRIHINLKPKYHRVISTLFGPECCIQPESIFAGSDFRSRKYRDISHDTVANIWIGNRNI